MAGLFEESGSPALVMGGAATSAAKPDTTSALLAELDQRSQLHQSLPGTVAESKTAYASAR